MTEPEKCETCKWFQPEDDEDVMGVGSCHIHAPSARMVGWIQMTRWPFVGRLDFCGQHEAAKDTPEYCPPDGRNCSVGSVSAETCRKCWQQFREAGATR